MATGIAVTRGDLAGSVREARRMLALALVVEDTDRATAARNCGMDRQTLGD